MLDDQSLLMSEIDDNNIEGIGKMYVITHEVVMLFESGCYLVVNINCKSKNTDVYNRYVKRKVES